MSTLLKIYNTMEYGPAPESSAAVKAWLDEHNREFGLFINNQWVSPEETQYYSSLNPATGELLGIDVHSFGNEFGS